MGYLDNLSEIQDEIAKCMKCGNCQAVCPLYKETQGEAAVARGKIRLADALLKGQLEYNREVAERFMLCLTCKACNANCPCGVKVDKIVLATRAALARKKGLPPLKKAIFQVLKRPGLFDLGLKAGSRFQGLVMKPNGKGGNNPRFPVGLDMKRVFPSLAREPFRDQVPEITKGKKPRMRVAFFTGCVTNYLYPSVGHAVVNLLQAHDVEVIVPRGQHCCGAPVLIHGDVETAREMAKSHLDIFTKVNPDAIITVCGTCGGSFRSHYSELTTGDRDYHVKAALLGAKTYDIAQFFTKVLPLNKALLKPLNLKVTYHDPCHLTRGMGVTQEPRQLIKEIPGVELIEMKNANRCCGSAGSFSLSHYDLTEKISNKKIAAIAETGAAAVITGCGSCRMQLEEGLCLAGLPQKVHHTAELVAAACGLQNLATGGEEIERRPA